MMPIIESENTTLLSLWGFNQKFLETETGRALVEALTMLGKSGFAPDNTLVEDQEGVIDEQNVKD